MTLHEAITALLDEYQLEDFVDVFRDDAKADRSFTGLSHEHPRVQRFVEMCRVLRESATKVDAVVTAGELAKHDMTTRVRNSSSSSDCR